MSAAREVIRSTYQHDPEGLRRALEDLALVEQQPSTQALLDALQDITERVERLADRLERVTG